MKHRRRSFTPLSRSLPQLFSDMERADQARLAILRSGWEGLVGAALARHTEPLQLRDGALTIGVKEDRWKSELIAHARLVIQRVNDRLGPGTVRKFHVEVTAEPPKPPSSKA